MHTATFRKPFAKLLSLASLPVHERPEPDFTGAEILYEIEDVDTSFGTISSMTLQIVGVDGSYFIASVEICGLQRNVTGTRKIKLREGDIGVGINRARGLEGYGPLEAAILIGVHDELNNRAFGHDERIREMLTAELA